MQRHVLFCCLCLLLVSDIYPQSTNIGPGLDHCLTCNNATTSCTFLKTVKSIDVYACPCKAGYKEDGDDCINVNECSSPKMNDCDINAHCTDTEGNYTCKCNAGFSGDGQTCNDIDECSTSEHSCTSPQLECVNTKGGYECKYKRGYTSKAVNGRPVSENINKCTNGAHKCHAYAICSDTEGSYNCSCRAGFSGDGKDCTDVDECLSNVNKCSVGSRCVNNVGGYTCDCISGYQRPKNDSLLVCEDINECISDLHSCDDHAHCKNTDGAFECQCSIGFKGNGSAGQCQAIDGGIAALRENSTQSRIFSYEIQIEIAKKENHRLTATLEYYKRICDLHRAKQLKQSVFGRRRRSEKQLNDLADLAQKLRLWNQENLKLQKVIENLKRDCSLREMIK